MQPPSLSFLLLLILFFRPSAAAFTAEEDRQIETFRQYLRIRTAHPDPDYASAAAFLIAQARSIPGLRARAIEFVAGKPVVLLSLPGSDPSLPSLLLNSHIDSVPPGDLSQWLHPPFAAVRDPSDGRIFARGAQDDKCLAIQILESLRGLGAAGFSPLRSIHVSFVPDEEIGGDDGAAKLAASEEFRELNVGFVLDEGQASPKDEFRVFYADRTPWKLIVRAVGPPGHGSRMYDGSAVENLMDCAEAVARFRESQFDKVKAGMMAASEVISINPMYMKAGTPTPMGFVMNMQPSEAEIGFDVRLPPTADPEMLKRRIDEEWAPAIKNLTFKELQIDFTCYDHPVVLTVEAQAKYVGHLGGQLSKNLLLKDKKQRFYVVSALANTKVDLKVLSQRLGLGKGGLRMAPEECLQEVLQVPPGCVTPFGLINDSASMVAFLLDQGFKSQDCCYFHPLTNDMTISISASNLEKFLVSIGRQPSYVDFEANPPVGKDNPPDLATLVPSGAIDLPNSDNPAGATAVPQNNVSADKKALVFEETKILPSLGKEAPKKSQDVKAQNLVDPLAEATNIEKLVEEIINKMSSAFLPEDQLRVVNGSSNRVGADLARTLMTLKNAAYTQGFQAGMNLKQHPR